MAVGGFPQVDSREATLSMFLRGIEAELAMPIRQSKPVTPIILAQIYRHVNLIDLEQIVAYTALLIGFYLFLRSGNLVPESMGKFQPGKQLTRGHVSHWEQLTLVEIHWSKTIQYKQKVLRLPLIPSKIKQICPVYWLNKVLQLIPGTSDDPIFLVPRGDSYKPLTYDMLRNWFLLWVEKTGREPSDFSLHGLRRGGASWGLQAGLTGEELKLMGDWASQVYLNYLDTEIDQRVKNMVQFMDKVETVFY